MPHPLRAALFVAAFGLACAVPAAHLQMDPRARAGADPDTTVVSGTVQVLLWRHPAMFIVRVPDTLVFLYAPHNTATVDSVARREHLRCAINGSFFSGVRGDARHAGFLSLYGRILFPASADRQLTHIVRLNQASRRVEFLPAGTFVSTGDPHAVEFQTGPLLIENGTVREDLIRSSINGLTGHTRTLMAALDRSECFFITVTERITLGDLAASLNHLSVFRGRTLDVVNLDGGSSVALYLRDAPGLDYNAGDRLPILIGFH